MLKAKAALMKASDSDEGSVSGKETPTNQLEGTYENDQIDQVIDAKKNEESERACVLVHGCSRM